MQGREGVPILHGVFVPSPLNLLAQSVNATQSCNTELLPLMTNYARHSTSMQAGIGGGYHYFSLLSAIRGWP